ncbi:pro-resilin-like [Penaeus monodon]|uniref:pro-resilin-like n=1 Tax=Penaeus monodon TaxID=6687 RepID=UPI0018A79E0A|nr:pro-resilin-like [Penaeus monodon]
MKVAAVVLACLVAAARASPQEGYNYQAPSGQGSPLPGSGSGQFPSGSGQFPSGSGQFPSGYYVQLPDGRRLVVEYYADSTGYHPTISYEGEAQFPSGPSQGAGQGYQGGSGPNQGFPQGGSGPNQGFPQGGSGPNQGFPQGGSGPDQSYLPPSK